MVRTLLICFSLCASVVFGSGVAECGPVSETEAACPDWSSLLQAGVKVLGNKDSLKDTLSWTATPSSGLSSNASKPEQQPVESHVQRWGSWNADKVKQLVSRWPAEKLAKLQRMANKTMWEVFQYSAIPQDPAGTRYFVQAGQLPQMWLRDSTASVHHLFTTGAVDREPHLMKVVEGLARTLAQYIKKDRKCSAWEPYDNGRECRGGGSYNDMRFELDSPMYVLRMFRLLKAHGSAVTDEAALQEATSVIVKLARDLKGPEGLLSTESRPSDDSAIGYNIPDNYFVAVELSRLDEVSKNHADIHIAKAMSEEIMKAIAQIGTKDEKHFGKVFCYEATKEDCLIMDDANVPSLMALPYLDDGALLLDEPTYSNTRRMLLSRRDPYYYQSKDGRVAGIGSPHVPGRKAWPMSMASQALTAKDPSEVSHMLDMLLLVDSGEELMHESVDVDHLQDFTRPWFDWPNALFAELVDKCCSDLVGTRAASMPIDVFAGWQTCGFRDGMCSLKGTTYSDNVSPVATLREGATVVQHAGPRVALHNHPESATKGFVCARYGCPFEGFHFKRVALTEFPFHCRKDFFGVSQSGAYHCALAEADKCP